MSARKQRTRPPAPPPYPTGTADDAIVRRARAVAPVAAAPPLDTRYAVARIETEIAAMRAQLDRIEMAVASVRCDQLRRQLSGPAHRKDRLTRS